MLQIMPIMLNYAVYANLCLRGAKMLLNLRNYANYALCSDSAIMPKSNAGIIGPPQGLARANFLKGGTLGKRTQPTGAITGRASSARARAPTKPYR